MPARITRVIDGTIPSIGTSTAKTVATNAKPATAKAHTAPAKDTALPSQTKVQDRPKALTRIMTVVLPGELTTEVLNTRQLQRHLGVAASTSPRLWVKPGVGFLRRTQLVDVRRGTPTYCAGGPLRMLDLGAMRHAAAVGAGIRHQHWTQVVHGSRPATPWASFLARHLQEPDTYTREQATEEFLSQPRACAMRMHNAAQYATAAHLDPYELEFYQAGQAAYAGYHSLLAICTDAVLTAEGTRLAPTSAYLTDWVTYLDRATRHIESLDPTQRLLTVMLHQ